MIKKLPFYSFLLFFCCSCATNNSFEKATSALDGGRYFIESTLQGDFKKAKYFILQNDINRSILDSVSSNYFGLDKESRQQLRLASIQINEVSSIDSNNSVINYQNSVDKTPRKIKVILTEDGWKVDLK